MKITFFYSKRTGKIMSYCRSEVSQDMSYFGENAEDMSLVYDFVVFDYTTEYEQVINNRDSFTIDLETKELNPPINTRVEIQKLKEENESLRLELEITQDALDQLIFNSMGV